MSGGSGRRFWPLSRAARAKQLIPLIDGKSLLELTVERLKPLFAPENIVVVIQKQQYDETARILERFGGVRILSEPVGKNTAPCIAFASAYIESLSGDAVAAYLPADHFIRLEDRFRHVLSAGMDFVEETGKHLTLGIEPDRPSTGFGYIRKGSRVAERDGLGFFRVAEFTEKPSLDAAEAYLETGEYFWNAGIFVFKTSSVQREIRTLLPDMGREFDLLRGCFGTPEEDEKLDACYSGIRSISIDYGVMEKTEEACVVPVEIGWDDLGTWEAFSRYLPKDERGNTVHGKYIGVDSSNCLVYSEDLFVATLGVSGLAVIATGDALLVVPKERGEEVKRIVELIEGEGMADLL
jgi:mannose-1-phosphate guanylyltransferase